jgi:hypothetical protein
MAKTSTTTQGLRAAIERSGYYPALVAEAVEAAVGGEPIRSTRRRRSTRTRCAGT